MELRTAAELRKETTDFIENARKAAEQIDLARIAIEKAHSAGYASCSVEELNGLAVSQLVGKGYKVCFNEVKKIGDVPSFTISWGTIISG